MSNVVAPFSNIADSFDFKDVFTYAKWGFNLLYLLLDISYLKTSIKYPRSIKRGLYVKQLLDQC